MLIVSANPRHFQQIGDFPPKPFTFVTQAKFDVRNNTNAKSNMIVKNRLVFDLAGLRSISEMLANVSLKMHVFLANVLVRILCLLIGIKSIISKRVHEALHV